MNNTQHTPGPLRIDGTHLVADIAEEPLPHAVVRDSNERWVALVEITDDEGRANATLIAAAPAMYEALKLCKAFIDHGPSATRSAARCKEVYDNALAQAEGKP